MVRSLIVILLAIVCGVCAAFGVNQLARKPAQSSVQTQTVYVAAKSIRRGAMITAEEVVSTEWPADLIPPSVAKNRDEIVGRSALSGITKDEPFFKAKLAETRSGGFASNVIPKGKRACTILTKGPSASVAGFVRPGDRVDVLVNLRGSATDETGGGTTVTLLHAVEILALDDIMDVESSTMKMWIKEGLTSVTLLVTPEQSLQLSLGQANGTLNLALRNGDDASPTVAPPVTMKMIREMRLPQEKQPELTAATPEVDIVEPPTMQAPPTPPITYIRTLRGTQSGYIQVVGVDGTGR